MTEREQQEKVATAPAGYGELLRTNRAYRRLWLGQVVSQCGDWFNLIAVYTLAQKFSGTGRAASLVLIARFLPMFVLGPIAGVVADRFNRQRVMIIAECVCAVAVLGLLGVQQPSVLWLIYACTVLELSAATFFDPANKAALPSIVAEKDLGVANALSSVTWSVMLTAGATLGGIVVSLLGVEAAFLINSASYLVAAGLIASINLPPRPPRARQKFTWARALGVTDWLDGWRYVWARPRLLAYLLIKPAWGVMGGMLALLAVFGEKVFPVAGSAALGIGVLYTARGVGTALGPILVRRWLGENRERMQKTIGWAFLLAGLFYIGFGAAPYFVLALLALMTAHAFGSVIWVHSTLLLQRTTEDDFRGRVFASETAIQTLVLTCATYATGELQDRFGFSPRAVAVIIGLILFPPGILWFVSKTWWDKPLTPGQSREW